jgi:hypothetical protein
MTFAKVTFSLLLVIYVETDLYWYVRDIEDSFAELNISGIENDNDMESSIDEEYTYIIQILPSVLKNLAEANQDNTLRNFIKLVLEKMDPEIPITLPLAYHLNMS